MFNLDVYINKVSEMIKSKKYSEEDFMFLAYTIKKNNKNYEKPIVRIANELCRKGHNIFYPMHDSDEITNEALLKNKILFSSFHQ